MDYSMIDQFAEEAVEQAEATVGCIVNTYVDGGTEFVMTREQLIEYTRGVIIGAMVL